ncbi:hypothetical protein Tco_1517966 [Tanacetum coccineum]
MAYDDSTVTYPGLSRLLGEEKVETTSASYQAPVRGEPARSPVQRIDDGKTWFISKEMHSLQHESDSGILIPAMCRPWSTANSELRDYNEAYAKYIDGLMPRLLKHDHKGKNLKSLSPPQRYEQQLFYLYNLRKKDKDDFLLHMELLANTIEAWDLKAVKEGKKKNKASKTPNKQTKCLLKPKPIKKNVLAMKTTHIGTDAKAYSTNYNSKEEENLDVSRNLLNGSVENLG